MISKNTIIHSLRIAIATLIAALVGEKLGVGHIYWMMFTVVLVLQAELGSSIKKSTQRIVGTLIGAPIGIIIIMIIGEYNTLSITGVMTLSIVVVILTISKNYAIAVVFITMSVMLGYGLLGDTNLTNTALQRVVDTLAGTFIAVLTAIIVFPSSINNIITDEWVKFLKSSGDMCQSIADGVLGETSLKEVQERRKNYLKDVDMLTRRGSESAWEFSIFGTKALSRELRESIIKTPILFANRFLEMSSLHSLGIEITPSMATSIKKITSLQVGAFYRYGDFFNGEETKLPDIGEINQQIELEVENIIYELRKTLPDSELWEYSVKVAALYTQSIEIMDILASLPIGNKSTHNQ